MFSFNKLIIYSVIYSFYRIIYLFSLLFGSVNYCLHLCSVQGNEASTILKTLALW